MKREIRFRAWDSDAEEMIYSRDGEKDGWWEIDPLRYGYVSGIDGGNQFEPAEPIVTYLEDVMQFTGLKDKNGKEIYEGDIISYKTSEQGDNKEVFNTKGVVEYDHGAYRIDGSIFFTVYLHKIMGNGKVYHVSPGHFAIPERYCMANDFEVIGNIYENPELLK